MTSSPLLDTATAALALGVTPRTVRRLVASGDLTNHGTPDRIRVHRDDLATYQATRPRLRRRLVDMLDKVSA